MKEADWKQLFVTQHNLGHVDPTILRFLLDRPDPTTPEAVEATANALLITILDDYFLDNDGEDANGWSARITAPMPKAGEDDDALLLIDGQEGEPPVTQALRKELEADVARAADELRPLRALIKPERDMVTARSRNTVVATIRTPRPADWAVWLAMPSWTSTETAALLLDLEPNDVKSQTRNLPPKVRSALSAKLDHVGRHVEAGNLKGPITPEAVRKWASEYKQEAPAALMNKLESGNKTVNDDPNHMHHLTKTLYQKVLLYLAVSIYGYDVESAATAVSVKEDVNGGVGMNSIAAKMEADFDKAGVKISAKKLSEHLRSAAADLIGSGGKGVNVERLKAAKRKR